MDQGKRPTDTARRTGHAGVVAGGHPSRWGDYLRSRVGSREPGTAPPGDRDSDQGKIERRAGIGARVLLLAVDFYRRYLSPVLPDTCRFRPTCSEYAAQALLRYGVVKGMALSAWRLLRCQPLCRGGEDPVP